MLFPAVPSPQDATTDSPYLSASPETDILPKIREAKLASKYISKQRRRRTYSEIFALLGPYTA